MSSRLTSSGLPEPRIVDLWTVTPAALDGLWRHEEQWWREHLRWHIADALAALRRVVERRGVPGKAVYVGEQLVGYAYYIIAGSLGILSTPVMAPEWSHDVAGELLLQASVDAVRQQGVSRIESPCLGQHYPWLVPGFERAGFQTYWRDFLRLDLPQQWPQSAPSLAVQLEPWRPTSLHAAAVIMQAAYEGTVDTEMNALYGTIEGCRSVLDNLLNQGGCGTLVAAASALVYDRGDAIGFIIVTETAPRQGHLAQVAVLPEYQGQGIGRLLVQYSQARLVAHHFDTLSLIVSRANARALRFYRALGMQTVLTFPVFVRDPA